MFLPLRKKLQSIINKCIPAAAILVLLLLWQGLSMLEVVPSYMLPSPVQVVQAFVKDFSLLMQHAKVTLLEAFWGLGGGIIIGFMIALLMDRFKIIYKAFYPVVIITQTVPTVAIAPLLVLWFGYGATPKILLIIIATFFPITIGMLEGFRSVDKDTVNLLRAMGASKIQIFTHVKLKSSLGHFFSSLRISVSYAIVGAVISEWLGGFEGLGVYMTRVKKSYSFDKMFAVIFLISFLSLLLMYGVDRLKKWAMPWDK